MAIYEWKEPRLLIENVEGMLRINESVIVDLEQVDKPLVVVCIAGPYRTGKSYLLNRLAGKQSGFALGGTVEAKTKGIWVWVIPHPLDSDKALLLMDTEGLDDAFLSNENYDLWICCLSVLLSSVFVYNIVGRIENSIVDRLSFVTEISNHMRFHYEDNSDEDFDQFFPSFILSIRDFFLSPVIDGREVTSDEYMEQMLLSVTKSSSSVKEKEKQRIRLKLRSYFKERKCFAFVRPVVADDKLRIVDSLSEEELEPEFLQEVNQFCYHIYTTSPVKKLDYVQNVNGRIFSYLVHQYVAAIQRGTVPCVKSTMDMVAEKENMKALEEAVYFYATNVQQLLIFPATEIHLADTHNACHRRAVEIFLEMSFLDNKNIYRDKLQERLENEYNRIVLEDSTASKEKCQRILADLFSYKIDVHLQLGTYISAGGYSTYIQDLEQVKFAYNSTPDKGVKSEEVLQSVLNNRISELIAIAMSDEKLTEAEQELEVERIKEKEAVQRIQLQELQMEEMQRHQTNLVESHNEHMKTAQVEFQRKMKDQQEEFHRVIGHRFAEQERLAKENFEQEAMRLRAQLR